MRCTGGWGKASSKEMLFVVDSRKKNRDYRIELENRRAARGVRGWVSLWLLLAPLAHYRTPPSTAAAVLVITLPECEPFLGQAYAQDEDAERKGSSICSMSARANKTKPDGMLQSCYFPLPASLPPRTVRFSAAFALSSPGWSAPVSVILVSLFCAQIEAHR